AARGARRARRRERADHPRVQCARRSRRDDRPTAAVRAGGRRAARRPSAIPLDRHSSRTYSPRFPESTSDSNFATRGGCPMRWTLLVATSAALAVLAAAAFVTSCTKQAAVGAAAMRAADRIALGKRLAWAAGCNDCHTPGALYGAPDTTRLLSGSELGWAGPWGVSYARNITPDTETGIG